MTIDPNDVAFEIIRLADDTNRHRWYFVHCHECGATFKHDMPTIRDASDRGYAHEQKHRDTERRQQKRAEDKKARRDTQRQKLYDAELCAPIGRHFDTFDDVQTYVRRLLKHKYVQRKYRITDRYADNFGFGDGRGRRNAGGRDGYITIPRWARDERIVLHEVAHALTDRTVTEAHAAHGWQFAAVFIDLVRHMMGAAAERELKAAFRERKVRWAPKRQGRKLTPEQREAAVARLAAARKAKT